MSLADSLLVSLFSMTLVFTVLVVLYILIEVFSRAVGGIKRSPEEDSLQAMDTSAQAVSPADGFTDQDMSLGTLKLKNVDEKTAAMIMAIVSHESGIPLSQLRFKFIKALEENN